MQDYTEIIQKAKELSHMIENHEITLKYRASLEKMRGDALAQQLLAELIHMGREISESINNPDSPKTYGTAEIEILNRKLEENPIVKEHLLVQRSYLDLVAKVQDKIKNPAAPE